MKTDIMHSFGHDKGKPAERRGRKTTGLRVRSYDSGATEAMFDCKSYKTSGQLYWPEARTDAACGENNNKFYRAHSGHIR